MFTKWQLNRLQGRAIDLPIYNGKSDPPPPPDYTGAAQAQGAANVDAARTQGRMNNPSFSNPYGSRQVQFNPDDSVNITDSLTPVGQEQFNTQNRILSSLGNTAESQLGRVQQGFGTAFDTSHLPSQVTNVQADDATRQRVEQSLLDRQQPAFDQQRSALETQLNNQGISRGSEAWDNSMREQNQRENDARLASIAQAGQEQSRLFGMGQQNAALANQGRQQGIQEEAYLRSLPLNELNALRTGNQVGMPQFQSFQGGGNIQSPDLMGATQAGYNAQLGNVNASNAQKAQTAGTAATLASLFLLSDRRMKEDIEHIGELHSGLFIYKYRYKGEAAFHIGVMADEAEQLFPDAVMETDDGTKMVDYSRIA